MRGNRKFAFPAVRTPATARVHPGHHSGGLGHLKSGRLTLVCPPVVYQGDGTASAGQNQPCVYLDRYDPSLV